MSEAPERIYLDGDVEAGDGMFPRCFENPKYASEPPVEYLRSDHVADMLKAEREKALHEAAEVCFAEKWKPKCSTDWVLARVKGHILDLIEKDATNG